MISFCDKDVCALGNIILLYLLCLQYTAAHWAAMHGNDQMLSTLLLNGADVNAKSVSFLLFLSWLCRMSSSPPLLSGCEFPL